MIGVKIGRKGEGTSTTFLSRLPSQSFSSTHPLHGHFFEQRWQVDLSLVAVRKVHQIERYHKRIQYERVQIYTQIYLYTMALKLLAEKEIMNGEEQFKLTEEHQWPRQAGGN